MKSTLAIGLILITATRGALAGPDQQFAQCKAKLMKAHELKVLYAFDWKPPKEPHVMGGATYYTIPFDAKEGFAETINCFLMSGKSGCINFDIKHYVTGRATECFSGCKLRPV